MTVNEPVALPLCSLTVVRETIKGREQGPFSEPSQEKLTRFLAAADPLGRLTDRPPGSLPVYIYAFPG